MVWVRTVRYEKYIWMLRYSVWCPRTPSSLNHTGHTASPRDGINGPCLMHESWGPMDGPNFWVLPEFWTCTLLLDRQAAWPTHLRAHVLPVPEFEWMPEFNISTQVRCFSKSDGPKCIEMQPEFAAMDPISFDDVAYVWYRLEHHLTHWAYQFSCAFRLGQRFFLTRLTAHK